MTFICPGAELTFTPPKTSFISSFQVIVAIGRVRSLTEGYSVNTPLTLETENTTIDFSSTNNFCPDANSNNAMDSVSIQFLKVALDFHA